MIRARTVVETIIALKQLIGSALINRRCRGGWAPRGCAGGRAGWRWRGRANAAEAAGQTATPGTAA
eukprot:scaffold103799_cov18-Prasinocladus_malaysianus.AAC.1